MLWRVAFVLVVMLAADTLLYVAQGKSVAELAVVYLIFAPPVMGLSIMAKRRTNRPIGGEHEGSARGERDGS